LYASYEQIEHPAGGGCVVAVAVGVRVGGITVGVIVGVASGAMIAGTYPKAGPCALAPIPKSPIPTNSKARPQNNNFLPITPLQTFTNIPKTKF
jgi:hypothetical protein